PNPPLVRWVGCMTVVRDNPSLKLSILKSRHNSPLADFSWPDMTRDIKDYVNSCYDCNSSSFAFNFYGI
ncbi:hypothetical protein VP01_6429g1, partial [Puccinia sorghi]